MHEETRLTKENCKQTFTCLSTTKQLSTEHEIKNVLDIAKRNELQNLQWKVEYLRNEMLELDKTKSSKHVLELNRTIEQLRGNLPEGGWYDNTGNSYPIPYSEPYMSSYSIRLSYAAQRKYIYRSRQGQD